MDRKPQQKSIGLKEITFSIIILSADPTLYSLNLGLFTSLFGIFVSYSCRIGRARFLYGIMQYPLYMGIFLAYFGLALGARSFLGVVSILVLAGYQSIRFQKSLTTAKYLDYRPLYFPMMWCVSSKNFSAKEDSIPIFSFAQVLMLGSGFLCLYLQNIFALQGYVEYVLYVFFIGIWFVRLGFKWNNLINK